VSNTEQRQEYKHNALTLLFMTALPQPFIKLAWANLFAQAAEQLSLSATPIIAVLLLGSGAGDIGLLASAQTLPFLLLSIPLGLLADRMSRQRLMVISECIRTLSLIALLVCVLFNQVSIPILAVLGFIGAVGTVGFSVAAPALVPTLVPRAELGRANGKIELARSTAFAAGPAIAGAIVSWFGATPAFAVAACLSTLAVLLLVRVVDTQSRAKIERNVMADLKEGAKFIWAQPYLRPILYTSIAWNIAWFVLQAAYVPYAMRSLGLSSGAVGLTMAAYGVGMVTGSLLAPRVIRSMPFGMAMLVGPAFSVLASCVMLSTVIFPIGFLAGLSYFLFGVGPIIWTITSITLRQTVTPAAMLGRVGSMLLTVNFGIRPIGAALGAFIGSRWGEQACLVVSLLAFIVQLVAITVSAVRTLKALPTANPN
jgi:predicted MFS family arabinose efflux permease